LPSRRNQSPESTGIDWLAVLRTLVIQLLVLLALSAAVVRYVDWSSDRAFTEFTAARQPSPQAIRPPPTVTPAEAIKRKLPCDRGA
jgi:hypothetical protein